ncbi:MAG: hypothetical protein QMC93_01715 [Patescibacteria group bacterium]|nr:hypothetical protein [Patescibacteria group bacterium]
MPEITNKRVATTKKGKPMEKVKSFTVVKRRQNSISYFTFSFLKPKIKLFSYQLSYFIDSF